MFDANEVSSLNVPKWEAAYRAEIAPGVVAMIAIHDTTRGPALGGCRMKTYENEAQALTDVLRLSRGMTFKNAIADLPLGGGKAIIIAEPQMDGQRRQEMLTGFGKFVDWVNRNKTIYYSAEDMNTTVADMLSVQRQTAFICGTRVDPSPYTAWGVFAAIQRSVSMFANDLFAGDPSLQGKRILIQGLGKVGRTLAEHLYQAGARLTVTDIRPEAVESVASAFPGTATVGPENLYDVDADVFAPCAGGEVVTEALLDRLRFKVLCGAANNQLQNTGMGAQLQRRGIVYCPDYVANMGGVCAIQYEEIEGLSEDQTKHKISETVNKMLNLTFETAVQENLPFNDAVDHLVKKIVWGNKTSSLSENLGDLFPNTFREAVLS